MALIPSAGVVPGVRHFQNPASQPSRVLYLGYGPEVRSWTAYVSRAPINLHELTAEYQRLNPSGEPYPEHMLKTGMMTCLPPETANRIKLDTSFDFDACTPGELEDNIQHLITTIGFTQTLHQLKCLCNDMFLCSNPLISYFNRYAPFTSLTRKMCA